MAARRRRCTGKTTAGKRCQAWPLKGTKRCAAHPIDPGSARFGSPEQAAAAGALGGRPRLPRPHELMREKIEADLERVVRPYFDAIDGAMVVARHQGDVTVSDVPDLTARVEAAEALLSRVYGKPKQQLELGGSDVPITTEVVHVDDREAAAAAHEFLRRIAGGTDTGG